MNLFKNKPDIVTTNVFTIIDNVTMLVGRIRYDATPGVQRYFITYNRMGNGMLGQVMDFDTEQEAIDALATAMVRERMLGSVRPNKVDRIIAGVFVDEWPTL